jgi:tRNA pseudouridine55 synthase
MSKRAQDGIGGIAAIIAVDKPSGITSHDVVNRIRRVCGLARVGHCGTLDPPATGLLVVCIGVATRLADRLSGQRKRYLARLAFGASTDTDDASGAVTASSPVPAQVADAAAAAEALAKLRGRLSQTPPLYSALKRDGMRAHAAARRGLDASREPRTVEIFSADLISCGKDYWDVSFEVSKGTYIRSLARDIAIGLGTVGHLASLRRCACGNVELASALRLEDIEESGLAGLKAACLDPAAALGLPAMQLDDAALRVVANGGRLALAQLPRGLREAASEGARAFCCMHGGRLMAVYRLSEPLAMAVPEVVLPGGVFLPGSMPESRPGSMPESRQESRPVDQPGSGPGCRPESRPDSVSFVCERGDDV